MWGKGEGIGNNDSENWSDIDLVRCGNDPGNEFGKYAFVVPWSFSFFSRNGTNHLKANVICQPEMRKCAENLGNVGALLLRGWPADSSTNCRETLKD